MNDIQFRSLDLNLFRVLLALLDRGSVSGAADALALTPSAVSHALRRLRSGLGDPLFERRGGGLAPTPYAIEVGRRAGPVLEQLRAATEPFSFEPRGSDRQFVITGGSYSAAVVLPQLLDRLREAAPRVRVRFMPVSGDLLDAVERGRVDLAFCTAPVRATRAEWTPLFRDEMVWAARREHPLLRAPLTMEMLLRARHVVLERLRPIFSDGYEEARLLLDEASALRSAQPRDVEESRIVASVADLAHALAAVLGSDAVTLTLRRYVETIAPDRVQLLAPPHRTPTIAVGAAFMPRRDPGVDWLLEQLEALF